MIIATAGHIDHGKTVLVKALTGVDTDRLPEEKQRGLSIDLGFAYQAMAGGRVVGFVDVPGHERFVGNMLAGVTGIDFALLVVAADDGPMPQTEEHLAILDLLGVTDGAVALTKIDRVDERRVDEVSRAIEALVAPTCLAGAPVFPVSGLTGAGIDALHAHIGAAAERTGERPVHGNFRLAVDRSFTLAGIGLVVTGTVFSGRVAVGDNLVVSPRGGAARVRAIHAQNRESAAGSVGQRCALNLSGPGRADVRRGDWLVAEAAHAPLRRLDARIRLLAHEPRPLRGGTMVHLHLGAAEVTARAVPLEGRSLEPGAGGLVQLIAERPIGAVFGDRLILRDRSARRTMGGGHVVDPHPPARGRARPERLARLGAMDATEPSGALAALLDMTPDGVDLAAFARARNLAPDEAEALWQGAPMVRFGPTAMPRGIADDGWQAVRAAVLAGLDAWHRDAPDDTGPTDEALRAGLTEAVPGAVFEAVVQELLGAGEAARDGARLHRPGHRAAMGAEDAALWERVRPLLDDGGLRPPRIGEIAETLGLERGAVEAFLRRCARLGLVVGVADNRFFPLGAVLGLGRIVEDLAGESPDGRFGAAQFRDRSGIGRNLTIEVLEFFDRRGLTARSGDGRRLLKPAGEIF